MRRTRRASVVVVVLALVSLGGCGRAAGPEVASGSSGPTATPSPAIPGSASPGVSPAVSPSSSPVEAGCVALTNSFTEDARGPKGDPVELARAVLSGLRPTDRLTRLDEAGGGTRVVITRDKQELGGVHFFRDPDGGWLLDGADLCGGLGIPSD